MADSLYITLTDFRGQRYVVEMDSEIPATAASLATKMTPQKALAIVRDKIVKGEPIRCDLIHDNSHTKTMTIFHGPVTLSYHYERSNQHGTELER